MEKATSVDLTKDVPRSQEYKDKELISESLIIVKGTRYLKRVFFDKSVELVRYDFSLNKWVFLLFV